MAPRPASALSLRERKKQRTLRDLQAAALQLIAEHGFDGVTTDDIAAAADVSKTTFYRYFDSKEDVILGDSQAGREDVRRALRERPGDEPVVDSIRNAILTLANRIDVENDRTALLARANIVRATSSLTARALEQQAAIEQVMVEFIADRNGSDPRSDLEARLLAATTMAALRVATDHWVDHDGELDLEDLVHRGLAFLAVDRA
jgi:AcrR family transcriptional regulator